MQAIIKKIFLAFVLMATLLFLALVITLGFFEDRIGQRLLYSVNQQLESPLETKGFDLSLITSFPYASVRMDNVRIQGTAPEPLLKANKLYFNLSLPKLLDKHLLIRSIRLEEGEVFILKDRDNQTNYQIWKASNTPSAASGRDIRIDLKEAILENIQYYYVDEKAGMSTKGQIDKADFTGKLANKQFELSSYAEIQSDYVQLKNDLFLKNQPLVYDTDMYIDLDQKAYTIHTFNLGLAGNVAVLHGQLSQQQEGLHCQLEANLEDANAAELLTLMPEDTSRNYLQWLKEGTVNAHASVEGLWTKTQYPLLTATAELSNGMMDIPEADVKLKRISCRSTLNYNPADKHPGKLTVDDLEARFKRSDLQGAFLLEDFANPHLNINFEGELPLALFQPYLTRGMPFQSLSGNVDIEALQLKGPAKDLGTGRFDQKVNLTLDDVALQFDEKEIRIREGRLQTQDNSMMIDAWQVEAPGTRCELNGSILNAFSLLQKDPEKKQPDLKVHAVVEGEQLDLDEVIALFSVPQKTTQPVSETNESGTIRSLPAKQDVECQVDIRFDKINYRQANGEELDASMRLLNRFLEMHVDVQTMEGNLKWDGYMDFKENTSMHAIVDLANIDVNKCFRDCENFGQDFITDQHLKGVLNANVLVEAKWDDQGNFLEEELHVLSNLVINDGSLKNFKLLYDFADYIKIQDLRDIRFANMQNWLEIRNGKVFIPVTFIQSNAANLSINGIHSFDNRVDYNLKINAGQVFFNKFSKYNPDKDPLKARKKGFVNLYFHLYGPTDNIQYTNSKARVRSEFERSEKIKREVRRKLEMAFGEELLLYEPEGWQDEIPEYTEEVEGEPIYLDNF